MNVYSLTLKKKKVTTTKAKEQGSYQLLRLR